MGKIKAKRVYEPVDSSDGFRVLVDRVWPRGVSKEQARVDRWLQAVAPSTELRKWFGHDPAKWAEFKERYFEELEDDPPGLAELLDQAQQGTVTLVYSARDSEHNQAVALQEFLQATRK